MKPLVLYSRTRTKFKSIFWGMFCITLGLALGIGMTVLWSTEGFSAFYIIFAIPSALLLCAGCAFFNWQKYPIELLADDKGLHYFIYANRWGYSKRELVLLWKEIKNISIFSDENDINDEIIALEIEFESKSRKPLIINLDDTIVSSETIPDVLLKIDEIRGFYCGLGKE